MAIDNNEIPFERWSESDDVSIAGFTEPQLEGCHWYGQKEFASAIARIVFRASQDLESVAGLETLEHSVLSAFSYKSQLETLRKKLSFAINANIEMRSVSPRQIYLTVVGAVNSTGNANDRKAFADGLQEEAHSILKQMSLPNFAGTSAASDVEMDNRSNDRYNMPSPASDDEIEDPRLRGALTALYEYGIRNGFFPSYQDRVSTGPLAKLIRVTINGRSFEGFAQNKKLAKQVAALKACEALGVSINVAV